MESDLSTKNENSYSSGVWFRYASLYYVHRDKPSLTMAPLTSRSKADINTELA